MLWQAFENSRNAFSEMIQQRWINLEFDRELLVDPQSRSRRLGKFEE